MRCAYIGLVHRDEGSDYGISFPDFPGCITADESLDRALTMAHEALQFHIDGMIADDESIPEPGSLHELGSLSEGLVAVALIEAEVPERGVRVPRGSA